MADLYDLYTLDAVARGVVPDIKPFYLTVFNRQMNFDTPEIYFEKIGGDDRMLAPFVVPTMQGRPQKLQGYEAMALAPAYVKILDPVEPSKFIARRAGETFGTGSLSLEQRRQAVIAELLRKAQVAVTNRLEWLAARAIIDGQVTISGEDYPSTLVDFRRDAGLTIVKTGASRWNQAGVDPLVDLKNVRVASNELSGSRIRKVIFGQNAWDSFAARVDLKELMNRNFGGMNVNVTLMSDGYLGGQELMGTIAGSNGGGAIEAWVDTSRYIDPEDGVTKYFLDQDTVIGIAPEVVQGVRCFGAIMDAEAGYRPLERFYKNYRQPNPSVEYLLTQSAPLMVPKYANGTFSIKVQ